MAQDHAVEEWARTAEFSQPVRWGEIEAGILAREPIAQGGRIPGWWLVRIVGAWVGIAIFGTLFYGSSLIGLVIIGVGAGSDVSWDWIMAARVAFVVAAFTQITSFLIWWQTRRRHPLDLPVSALTVVASVAAYVVLLLAAEGSRLSWLPLVVLVAGALGIAMLVLSLVSRPEGRDKSRKPPRRGPRSGRKEAAYLATRRRVLDILTERRLVDLDEADRIRLPQMPLGYWDELDGVDEKEWRRVLELRSVGWREFDESDRRPWPPVED